MNSTSLKLQRTKTIIASILLITGLQLTATTAPMIINRSGQSVTVTFMNGANPLFTANNSITVNGTGDHTGDQMVLIPSTSIQNLNSPLTPKGNYQNSATSATITIGSASVSIPSFVASSSYAIVADPANVGKFIANAGLIVYDTASGAATPGSPTPVAPGAGF